MGTTLKQGADTKRGTRTAPLRPSIPALPPRRRGSVSPRPGASVRIAPGVAESLGTMPGTSSTWPVAVTMRSIMPRAR
jgi:hypothetical protein